MPQSLSDRELSDPVKLLAEQPRIFWGKVIRLLIERGWTPPPPDERIVDELLEDMTTWDVKTRPRLDFGDVEAFEILTPQEARVAHLVAMGASNHEVAVTLCVTKQTIKFHLTNIYRKLGVSSRSQLAALTASRE